MAELASSTSIVDRMVRAARLDVQLYEEVEADLNATNQALLVVVIVALATGIGQAVSASMDVTATRGVVGPIIGGLLSALLGWAVWSYVVYYVGTRSGGQVFKLNNAQTSWDMIVPNNLLLTPVKNAFRWFVDLFTVDKPVVFAFHGYQRALHEIVHGRPHAGRFHVRGFNEQGTTTTPFNMVVLNEMSRYHLAIEAIRRGSRMNGRDLSLIAECRRAIDEATAYAYEHFEDPPEISQWVWA